MPETYFTAICTQNDTLGTLLQCSRMLEKPGARRAVTPSSVNQKSRRRRASPPSTHTPMSVRTSFAKHFKLTRSRVTPKVGGQASATPKAGQATRRRSWVLSLPTVRSWCFDPHPSYPSTQLSDRFARSQWSQQGGVVLSPLLSDPMEGGVDRSSVTSTEETGVGA